MTHVKLSICAACFNHSGYLAQSINSIEYSGPTEFVGVDDASTDGSFQELSQVTSAARDHGRLSDVVLYQNSANRGAHFSLNKAAALASGDVLAFLNTDDFYSVDRFSPALIERAADGNLVFSSVDLNFSPSVAVEERLRWIKVRNSVEDRMASWQRSKSKNPFIDFQVAFTSGNIIIRKDLFWELGGFRALKYCHDWEFLLRSTANYEMVYDPRRTYNYRLHPKNSFRDLGHLADAESVTALRSYLGTPPWKSKFDHPALMRSEYDTPQRSFFAGILPEYGPTDRTRT